jgi:hypothetical protein
MPGVLAASFVIEEEVVLVLRFSASLAVSSDGELFEDVEPCKELLQRRSNDDTFGDDDSMGE